jgi:hypothetical protein
VGQSGLNMSSQFALEMSRLDQILSLSNTPLISRRSALHESGLVSRNASVSGSVRRNASVSGLVNRSVSFAIGNASMPALGGRNTGKNGIVGRTNPIFGKTEEGQQSPESRKTEEGLQSPESRKTEEGQQNPESRKTEDQQNRETRKDRKRRSRAPGRRRFKNEVRVGG